MVDPLRVFEILGQFYLGRHYDMDSGSTNQDLVLYDSRDLVTHAFCVGMTGSGKTGLGITLLEEAAIDGIPALVVDPKGDMTNLLLAFPDLAPADFLPWVHADEAAREGLSREAMAERKAALWRDGLATWDQSTDRIKCFRDSCDFTIFTPGSDAGVPISILSSFEAPGEDVKANADAFQDRVSITVTSLLTLLGIDTDPIRSREHILLTVILDHCWRNDMDLDLGSLIRMLQNPPVTRVGVIELETFYPAKERFNLAMQLNNLLAAPGFASWMTGEPLNVKDLLYTASGRPRMSIFYTAHLSEPERLFFTALLLNQTLGWMREQAGTMSLRALLYIDELFGYLPPVGEPATKKPLLTLLKQARAYGLGVILATQNPIDIDYKGLSNIGTWFLGRLQTERDKARVLDGLEGAGATDETLTKSELSRLLSSLDRRVFLMRNVHEDTPVVFQSRWALSYLAGPMTRDQVRNVMERKRSLPSPSVEPGRRAPSLAEADAEGTVPVVDRPILPPSIEQTFLVQGKKTDRAISPPTYLPHVAAWVHMHYVSPQRSESVDEEFLLIAPLADSPPEVDWRQGTELLPDRYITLPEPPIPGNYAAVPAPATQPKSYHGWAKALSEHLYHTRRYRMFACEDLREFSQPGEGEREFRIRLSDLAREERDRRSDALRAKYAGKIEVQSNRVQIAEERVEREVQAAESARGQTILNTGQLVLNVLLGRKIFSSANVNRASGVARRASRANQKSGDLRRAEKKLEMDRDKLLTLEEELQAELQLLEEQFQIHALQIDERLLKPRRQDVDVRRVALAWLTDELAR